jgi:hypothetical protein
VSVTGGKPLVAIQKAENVPNSIVMKETEHDGTNDVVQTGTQPSARHNSAFQFGRIEIDLLPGPCLLEGGRALSRLEECFDLLAAVVIQNIITIGHMVSFHHGRGDATFPQLRYGTIQFG